MRAVFAVGAVLVWPFEVYALFSSEAEARRHSDAAAFEFAVAPLPVYDSYDDLPVPLRPDASPSDAMRRAGTDEAEFARLLLAGRPSTSNEPAFAVGDFETTCLPEVRAFYESRDEAERHIAAAYQGLYLRVMAVYDSYDDCPADRRFDAPAPALSQLVQPRRPPLPD